MNKICSIFIILIIIYLSYDYCSQTIEGQGGDVKDDSKISDDEDESFAGLKKGKSNPADRTGECPQWKGTKETSIKLDGSTEPCAYTEVHCRNSMETVSTSNWADSWNTKETKDSKGFKARCQACVQGSKKDGNTSHVLANVGRYKKDGVPQRPLSNFSADYCDALAASCGGSSIIYANNKQDSWGDHDCKEILDLPTDQWQDNALNIVLCKILSNRFIQFFLNFMGGIECTLKIKGYQVMGDLKKWGNCESCCATTVTDSGKKKCADKNPGCTC